MRKFLIIVFTAVLVTLVACDGMDDEKIETIVLADAGWDSLDVHNFIAQTIIEEGFDYDTEITTGATMPLFQGVTKEDINVFMEVWKYQICQYHFVDTDKLFSAENPYLFQNVLVIE